MKNSILITFIILILTFSCDSKKQEFTSLFNGKDLTNWTLEKPGSFEVIDGEMITRSSGSRTNICSEKTYSNFILQLEFLLSDVGNSGVFIRHDPEVPGSGFEVQLLAPWTPWRDDLHCTGSLYGHVAVTNRPDETTGKWYNMEIRCDRNKISVSVNDQITTIADIDTVKSLADKPLTGHIGFQGNHAENPDQYARFRNIRVRDLDSDPDYIKEGFKSSDWQVRQVSVRSAVRLGAVMIRSMADMMSGNDPMLKSEAKQALFDIVAKASDPSVNEKERKKVRREIEKSLEVSSSEITSNYLEWIMGMI